MINKTSKKKIVGLTTDPYNNIYGYSLVFFRLMDFIQTTYKNIDVELLSNNGVSSSIVKNRNFKIFKVDPDTNILLKFILLIINFIKLTYKYDKDTIIIANCEIPELIAARILKIKFKNVYGIIQDARVRDNKLFTKLVCKARIALLYSINNIIFTNRYTMNEFTKPAKKYYIGNPIFY